jgi:AcrR family transcriptional regulator
MVSRNGQLEPTVDRSLAEGSDADWQRRVVGRSLRTAAERSVDRGMNLIRATTRVLARANGQDITVQEVADEAGQSLRTLYQYFESKDDLLLAVFEEAMRTYAELIDKAIADLDDPLERLAGAIVAAVRMPEFSGAAMDRGLIRLRLKLSESQPEMIGRAQTAVASLISGLVQAASEAGQLDAADPEGATFLILSINAAFISAETVGNDAGVRRPDLIGITSFCLRGLGAELDHSWYERVNARLHFPAREAAIHAAREDVRSRPRSGRRSST